MAEVDESNARVFHALKSDSKVLSLDNFHLKRFPAAIVRLHSLKKLSAKSNELTDLETLSMLKPLLPQLISLNLGSNLLTVIPISHSADPSSSKESATPSGLPLISLYLYNNRITLIDRELLTRLGSLEIFNLNDNLVSEIPSTISNLKKLVALSLVQNQLEELPNEICHLHSLRELHLEGNRLLKLPNSFGKLKKLEKLYLQKNELFQIPSSLGDCTALTAIDLSCNRIQIFPNEIRQLRLRELHVEQNPLIPAIPLPSDQSDKILPLKELTSRFIVNELMGDNRLEKLIQMHPAANEVLAKVGNCAVCNGPFLHSWLDCVEFVNTKKVFKLYHTGQLIPLRITLCSYSCFNKDHNYYGIALPSDKNFE